MMRVSKTVRIAIDLAKARLDDAQREFDCAIREISFENAPDSNVILDISAYAWKSITISSITT